MKKISENIDLSKKVLEIDIQSPIFTCMLQDLDNEIVRVIDKVYRGEFEAGEVNLKLSLAINDDYIRIPKEDRAGEIINETHQYKRPYFEHKITSTLKKQYKQEGVYTEEKEVVFEDGQYIVKPIIKPQVNIFDQDQ